MQLNLDPHRQAVGKYPFGQVGRVNALPDRREKNLANLIQLTGVNLLASPLVVLFTGLVLEVEVLPGMVCREYLTL